MWSPSQTDTPHYAVDTPTEMAFVFSDSSSSVHYDEGIPSYTNLDVSTSSLSGSSPDSGYDDNSPFLAIEEEPETSYRFRYEKESAKPHGPLRGEYSEGKTPKNSSGPKVRLHNVDGEAIIRVWLYEGTVNGGPSPHRLLCTKNKGPPEEEPHDFPVNNKDCTVSFDKLNIVHVVVKEEKYQQCYLRKKAGLAKRKGDELVDRKAIQEAFVEYDKKEVTAEFKNKNKDICALYFEAFEKRGGRYYYIGSTISRPIKNKKSAKTNDLKILRASLVEGSALGGDTIFIFTEKLVKQIRIVFTDEDGDWEADAVFDEKDIHKQVSVAFKTPPYKNVHISKPVIAYYHIERTTDIHAESDPVKFRYLPARYDTNETISVDPPPAKRRCTSYAVPHAALEVVSPVDFGEIAGTSQQFRDPDPLLSSGCSLDDQVELRELLLFNDATLPTVGEGDEGRPKDDAVVVMQMGEDLDEVSTDDLVPDSLSQHALHAYCDWYKDSTPAARGPRSAPPAPKGPVSLSQFERARRLHLSIVQNIIKDVSKYLSEDTVNYKIGLKTPLHLAVQHERAAMVCQLLGAKADPYALDGVRSNTPVHEAILSSPSSLHILMSSAIPPASVFNNDGDDPLLFAIRNAKVDAVKLLVNKGFSLDASNMKDGDGPLHVALRIPDQNINYDMVCLLLKHEASVSRRNWAGLTALDVANAHPQKGDMIEKLSIRLAEEMDFERSDDEKDSKDSDGESDDLTEKLDSLSLGHDQEITDSGSSSPEPYRALDGDVETSKKVADLTQCAFLKPILVGAQKQSQVLLRQLERRMSPAEAVKTLNDAYARAKGRVETRA